MWRALKPDKLTLINKCWRVLARNITIRLSVHSPIKHADLDGCKLPSCQQKEINFAWADA